jgi:hypothetical protein
MKTLLLCLANSKKYSERCIAGIEVEQRDGAYTPLEKEGKPKWLRPVSASQFGSVVLKSVNHIDLLDIIEIEVKKFCPEGCQSENILFDEKSIRKVGSITLSAENLDRFTDMRQITLFGNRGKAVSEQHTDKLSHSLTFIKIKKYKIYRRESDIQMRMVFEFQHNSYDLPVTDTDFIKKYNDDETLLDNAGNIYLTVSLGMNHKGWHSKLIAGILYV